MAPSVVVRKIQCTIMIFVCQVKAIKEAVSVAAKEVEQAGDYQMDTHHKPSSVKKG